MTTDHAQSLRLGQRGAAPTPGVQLVTLATLPAVAYRGQIVYALDLDQFRVFDGDAWQVPTAATVGGTQTFVSATEPVADAVGDLWMKTTTYTLYVWDGSQWQIVQDVDAGTRDLYTWNLAQYMLTHGVTASTNVYYIATDPVSNVAWTVAELEWWFKSDTNQLFRRVSSAWVVNSVPETVKIFQQAGYPQAVGADQRISVYFQTGIPWANGTPNHGEDIGDIWIDTDASNAVYGFNGLWVLLSDRPIVQNAVAAAAAQSTADSALTAATPDGSPPSSSPDPLSLSGIGYFIVRWTPIVNADPVTYEIHVSSVSGFTADSSTKVGESTGSQFTVKRLPGPPAVDGVPDPFALDPAVDYYARIIARDADGSAAQSNQVLCRSNQVTGVDLAVDSVTAANIVSGTITGDLLSATVLLAGTIKTAETGQRVEVGIAGVQGFKSDNSLMINIPTDPAQNALLDANVVARSLTATNGGVLRQTTTLDPASHLTLKRVSTSPAAAPTMVQSYVTVTPSTASLSSAQKTDSLGTFDLVPTEVSFMEYKPGGTPYWVLHQVRPNGTRSWRFLTNGTPYNHPTFGYLDDLVNWETSSVIEITTSPGKNGVYRMARWIPHGDLNTYYLSVPFGTSGLNRYSRQNGATPPVVGSNGTDVFVAEIINSDELNIRYFTPNGDGNNISAPTTLYQSSQGYIDNAPLSTCLYDASGFDVSSGTGARYLTGYRGYNYDNQIIQSSGTNLNSLFPSGSGLNWTSATKAAHTFEPPSLPRCIAWDGSNFWTYAADGKLYQHTTNFYDTGAISNKVWAQHTFYDSNATGGTHESTPGPASSIIWKRRSSIGFSMPPLAAGGTDDPNEVRTYMGRGSTQPTNSNMWLQFSTSGPTAVQSTVTLSGSNPPTVNTFPNATPAQIDNDALELIISGDGTGTFKQLFQGNSGSTAEVLANPPYYYAWIDSGQAAGVNNTSTAVTSYTTEGSPFNNEITQSGGLFTIPRAGRYRLTGQLYWGLQASPAGQRICSWATGTIAVPTATLVSHTAIPSNLGNVVNHAEKTVRLAAGTTVFFRFTQSSGASLAPLTTTRDLSFINIEYVGA